MSGDPTAAWVARVNKISADMDELAATMHPSAWPEALADLRSKFEAAVKEGERVKEPRLRPTPKASKQLRELMRESSWYVPLPLTPPEQYDFADFLRRRGVTVETRGGLFDTYIVAGEDLSPHAREWRVWRGEAVWS